MLELNIWFYCGCLLAIIGSLGSIWGPKVEDPVVRTLNTEVVVIGVSLILLCFNHLLATLTFMTTSIVILLLLLRVISRLEEMEADV